MNKDIYPKINTMRAWVQRRRDKDIEPSADAIWIRIQQNWPYLDDAAKEAIFQFSKKGKPRSK